MKPGELLDYIRGEGLDLVVDGDRVRLAGPQTIITPELIEKVRPHKAALVDLLRSLPAFSDDDERKLVARYCDAPRAERLAIHNAGKVKHADGWPWREADLEAMRQHFEGKP